jgi:hypothetical protein
MCSGKAVLYLRYLNFFCGLTVSMLNEIGIDSTFMLRVSLVLNRSIVIILFLAFFVLFCFFFLDLICYNYTLIS